MSTARRGVGGAARGLAISSPGSSPGVSIPFSEDTSIRVLRRMLRHRDAEIDAMKRGYIWLNDADKSRLSRLDQERALIRNRIKAVSHEKKGAS